MTELYISILHSIYIHINITCKMPAASWMNSGQLEGPLLECGNLLIRLSRL